MKNARLNRQLQKLKWLIDQTATASNKELELQAHWGRYLCVLVAGFLENAIGEIYSEYASKSASEPVARFVSSQVLKLQNPNAQKFIETATLFKSQWGEELSVFLDDEGRRDALNAIMANRHLIVHGRDSGITVVQVSEHLKKAVEVIEFLENQCGL